MACVPAGRTCGLGRKLEDGTLIVRDDAAAVAAERIKQPSEDSIIDLGNRIVYGERERESVEAPLELCWKK